MIQPFDEDPEEANQQLPDDASQKETESDGSVDRSEPLPPSSDKVADEMVDSQGEPAPSQTEEPQSEEAASDAASNEDAPATPDPRSMLKHLLEHARPITADMAAELFIRLGSEENWPDLSSIPNKGFFDLLYTLVSNKQSTLNDEQKARLLEIQEQCQGNEYLLTNELKREIFSFLTIDIRNKMQHLLGDRFPQIIEEKMHQDHTTETPKLAHIEIHMGLDSDFDTPPEGEQSSGSKASEESQKGRNKKSKTPALDAFGNDITARAAAGKLDPMVGREKELMRLMHVLCRRKKNNPVLIGDPGVGKTAIVEGLAQRIVDRKAPMALLHKRIISLDTGLLVAGTKFRGEFEERIKAVMQEVKQDPNIILFIDEIHTIIGMGSAENSQDMANILKPALSRGEIRCIGASTLNEYAKTIEKNGALERRFQKIIVEPNTPEETLEILQQLRPYYEAFHNVKYSDEALTTAIELTGRYVSERFFPDKAIDALDEAGAGAHLSEEVPADLMQQHEEELKSYQEQCNKAIADEDYEQAAKIRDRIRAKEQALEQQIRQLKTKQTIGEIDSDTVAEVVARMTGVPTERVAQTEARRLKALSTHLKEIVIGQDEAIDKISKAIQRNRFGLRNEHRPIGSFLFLGPTGVGKTFLAKKLTEELFGDEEALIRLDMSEFGEKFTVSRLVGSPPGYVGYEEGGQLTEKIRHKPYSVLLLDEIEKAHPDVFNILLQLLDEGMLTDSFGRKVDFKNTVIIMTGNIGSRRLSDFGQGVGFQLARSESERNTIAKEIIDKELKRTFSPEFINRLDGIIHFNSLGKEDLRKIVRNELKKLSERIRRQGYYITYEPEVEEYLAKNGYDPLYGARPLNRLLQVELEDRFTDLILDEKLHAGQCVHFALEDDKISTHISTVEPVACTY